MDQPEPVATDVPKDNDETSSDSDIFLWANNLVGIKEELTIELFLFSKNYVVYKSQLNKELRKDLEPLFIDNLLEFVLDGAEQGMLVRGFEEAEAERNVLQRTQLSKVDNAKMVLNWLKTQENEIEPFVEEDHDFKRIKGVLVRCTHPDLKEPFYVIKALPQSVIMKGSAGWMLRGGTFVPFDAEGALRIPSDNQLLVLEQDIYVFNPAKLSSLFGYDAKKYTIAEKKMELIAQNFKLSINKDTTIETMVKGKKSLVKKLQTVDPVGIKQADLVNHAEELDLPLMLDNTGAIIIMDDKDLSLFINLLNEDYIESSLSGARYEITGKKPLKPLDDEDLLKQYG
jgi:hypothetical protein